MQSIIRITVYAFLITFVSAARADLTTPYARVIVDSIRGDDANAGSPEKPVRSLTRAQAVVRELVVKGPVVVEVVMRGGTYRLKEPLIFDRRDSLGKNCSISYVANQGDKVVISGGKEITGWKQVGKLWQTEIPEVREGKWNFRELFVGEERRPRARHPNEGYFRIDKAGADRRTSFTFKSGDLKKWSGMENLEFVMLHDWSISRVKFASIDEATNEAKLANPVGFPAPHYAMDHFEKQPRYFVENALDLVDSPGEWFLDMKTGVLSYLPQADEKIETFAPVAPNLTSLVQVTGNKKTGEPVKNLSFSGIRFEHCRWDTPAAGYTEGQATKHDPRDGISKPGTMHMVPAAVTFDLAENCKVTACEFRNLGGGGLWLREECQGCSIGHCVFTDIAGNGVMIGEPFTRNKPTLMSSAAINGVCRNNSIRKNEVTRCGQLYFGAVGIWVGIAAETSVMENHVHHLPYTGISMGWKWDSQPTGAEKNVIRENEIHDVLQTLSDGGGIYTLGRQPGSILQNNTIYNVPTNAGRAESNGIFMDEGSSEMLVEGNRIYNIAKSPIRFHKALNIHLKQNQLAHADGLPMFRYNNADPKTMKLEDNIRLGNAKGELDDKK